MNYIIIGNDKRYAYLDEMLKSEGHINQTPADLCILAPREDFKNYANRCKKECICIGGKNYSYSEAFTVSNSISTVEGALSLAINNTHKTIKDSRILVLGFGFLGKELAKSFSLLGGLVTVAARKPKDLCIAKSTGYNTVFLKELGALDYDIILNTIPAQVLTQANVNHNKHCIFIELASTPAFDKNIWNFQLIMAGGLPGKYAPYTAAKDLFEEIKRKV